MINSMKYSSIFENHPEMKSENANLSFLASIKASAPVTRESSTAYKLWSIFIIFMYINLVIKNVGCTKK